MSSKASPVIPASRLREDAQIELNITVAITEHQLTGILATIMASQDSVFELFDNQPEDIDPQEIEGLVKAYISDYGRSQARGIMMDDWVEAENRLRIRKLCEAKASRFVSYYYPGL